MSRVLNVLALLSLVACGADGEPIEPPAGVNSATRSTGAQNDGSVGVSKGPFRVGAGIF